MGICKGVAAERIETLGMDRPDWERVKELFAEAGDLAPGERAAFLSNACGSDAGLRSEVESLLAEHDESDDSFERNAVDLASAVAADGKRYSGRRFGHFEVIREIGSGGMGTVFLAKRSDGEFDQQIALKVIRNTIIDAETERRFRRERQILADLNHPSIAKLIDGGVSEDGEPFLAMEYVEGRSLIEYCDGSGLDVPSRLQIFTRICSAVSYAHQNLIVHRDIKPGNILVNAGGEPKLLDFGLAKIVDQNIFEGETTATVNRAFTPAYASPEQFLGKNVTTRSDVYSLGVVLFELLTGRKPYDFDGRSLDEIIRTISDSEPPRPSELSASGSDRGTTLRGDLDNIVLKAIQKDEAQRYASVDELTSDIERYLAGRPVSARPATVAYRAAKFFHRNRIAVSAAAAVFVALVLGLVVTLWQYNVARRERDLAEQRFNDVRRLSNSLLFEIAPRLERLPGSIGAREIIINRAVEYLDTLASLPQADLQLQAELAAGYAKIGDLQGNPANPNFIMLGEAIKNYEKALAIRRFVLERTPDDEALQMTIAENHRVLGRVFAETNDYEAEQEQMGSARGILGKLLAKDPASVGLKRALAQTNYDSGVGQTSLKGFGQALPFYDDAIRLLESAGGDAQTARLLGTCYAQKAYSLSWESRQPEAEAEMAKAVAIHEKLAVEAANDDEAEAALWLTYWLAGNINEEINDQRFYEFQSKAAGLARTSVAEDPSDIRAKQRLAKTLSHLGQAATNIGRNDEALGHLEESSRLYRGIIEAETRNGRLKADLAASLLRLGNALEATGNAAAAFRSFNDAVSLYSEVNELFPNDRRTKNNLATAHGQAGKLYEKNAARLPSASQTAREHYEKAVSLMIEMQNAQQAALSAYDLDFLEEMKAGVARLSN